MKLNRNQLPSANRIRPQNLRRDLQERTLRRIRHPEPGIAEGFEQYRNSRSRLISKTADRTSRADSEYPVGGMEAVREGGNRKVGSNRKRSQCICRVPSNLRVLVTQPSNENRNSGAEIAAFETLRPKNKSQMFPISCSTVGKHCQEGRKAILSDAAQCRHCVLRSLLPRLVQKAGQFRNRRIRSRAQDLKGMESYGRPEFPSAHNTTFRPERLGEFLNDSIQPVPPWCAFVMNPLQNPGQRIGSDFAHRPRSTPVRFYPLRRIRKSLGIHFQPLTQLLPLILRLPFTPRPNQNRYHRDQRAARHHQQNPPTPFHISILPNVIPRPPI